MRVQNTGHVAHGTPAALREFIAENIGMASIQADLVLTYAAIGDDRGLEYALRRFASYTKAALATFSDLKSDTKERGAA
jgi:hypothetical protein